MSRPLRFVAPSDRPGSRQYQQMLNAAREAPIVRPDDAPKPADESDRSRNPLRPRKLTDLVGQQEAKALVGAAVRRARATSEPLAHMLLVGPAGTGKSTLAHIAANELGVHVYQLAAPVSHDVLMELRTIMRDGDVLFVDELHLQAVQERRGRESITRPEILFGVLEDRVIPTATGVEPFPAITFIGGTTDEGMLSDAFLSRFPLRPRLVEYTLEDLAEIARRNAKTLGARLSAEAARIFAVASRGVPREINNLVRNALVFTSGIDARTARDVLRMNGIEEFDGLTADMAALLRFVFLSGRQQLANGSVRYQCSVSTIATGIGKSRDTKSVTLRIEPYLIRRGYLAITHSGRQLTVLGVERAEQLLGMLALSVVTLPEPTPAARALAAMGHA